MDAAAVPLNQEEIRRCVVERAEQMQPTVAESQTARPGLRLIPAHEMLAAPVAPAWLVQGLLTSDTLAVLFGESGSMKTFAALDIAVSVASGEPWQGLKVRNAGPAVYVAGEGFRGLSVRLQALVRHRGIDPRTMPLHFASQAVQFLDPDDAERAMQAVAALAETNGNPRLVVVDTLARCYGPGDENSTADMTRFVAVLDRLRERFGCCVLVLHHTGLMNRDRSRGSNTLRAALDWEYRLEVRDDTRTLLCTKSKDFEPLPPMHFTPQVVSTGWPDETGREIGSIVLVAAEGAPGKRAKALSGANRIALQALKAIAVDGKAPLAEWRKEAYRAGVSASEEPRARRMAFSRAVSALLDSGRVATSDDVYWIIGEQGNIEEQKGTFVPGVPGTREEQEEHTPYRGVPLFPCVTPSGEAV